MAKDKGMKKIGPKTVRRPDAQCGPGTEQYYNPKNSKGSGSSRKKAY